MEVCPMWARDPEQIAPFHFCVDVGDYTGISAVSYEDFLTSIKQVRAKLLRIGSCGKLTEDIHSFFRLFENVRKSFKKNTRETTPKTN